MSYTKLCNTFLPHPSYRMIPFSEDAIFREWNHSIRGMWQKSVTELRIWQCWIFRLLGKSKFQFHFMLCISQLGIYRVKIISVFLIQLFLTNSLIFMKRCTHPLMMLHSPFWHLPSLVVGIIDLHMKSLGSLCRYLYHDGTDQDTIGSDDYWNIVTLLAHRVMLTWVWAVNGSCNLQNSNTVNFT